MQALDIKRNLPVIPKLRHAFTDDEVEEFYITLCEKVFQAAANSLLRRYQSGPLEISNFLRCLEDETMSQYDIEAVSEFYGDWNSADIVRERHFLFARLKTKRLNRLISVTEITEDIQQNQAFADIAPIFISAFRSYIVLPSSTCKAKRSFSTLRRLKTCLCSTQTQQRLNALAIVNRHRNDANALDLNVAINKSVRKTQTRRNKSGISS